MKRRIVGVLALLVISAVLVVSPGFAAAKEKTLPVVQLIATGGTIAMKIDPEKKALVSDCRGRVKKAVEKLKGEYLFASPEQMLTDMEAGKERILELLELAQEFGRR